MLKISKLYIVFIIIAVLGFFIEGEIVLNLVFYTCIIITVISIISIIVINYGLEAKVECEKNSYNTMDEFEMKVVANNKTHLFIPFFRVICKNNAKISDFENEIFQLRPLEEKKIVYKLKLDKRGMYDFSDYSIEIKDVTMIFSKIKKMENLKIIKVYPKVYQINEKYRNKINYVSKSMLNKPSSEKDSSRIKEIRKYNYKDNYKKIHWKISSKTGELYVKEYEDIAKQNIKIFVDMREDILNAGDALEEKYISLAISIIKYFMYLENEIEVYLGSNYMNHVRLKDASSFSYVMNYFLKNKCAERESFFNSLKICMKDMTQRELICIVVFKIDDEIKNEIRELENAQMKVLVFYFDDKLDNDIYEHLNKPMVQYFNLNSMFKN
ncbi:DUF58 domain-containing protein [Clostridium hydrogenum]|uniref:DUF58 domain-containing protein n=1 Tax=Clostridium hydrogenum TaxID=2855764 RepID=UPI001F272F70|nr:DUF58 domain-containing protein [Clostridium hydrogenum]